VTHHVYLVPGFFGFTNLGELRYFSHVIDFLETRAPALGLRAAVHVVQTLPTASLPRRAARVLETVEETLPATGDAVAHLVGHSSGGLDVRLAVTPAVALDTSADVERAARRVRTVVTVSTPHHGTPLASFFTSLLGQRLLEALSLATMTALRFGGTPISVLLQLGALFHRLDDRVGLNSALLDQVFEQLLANFSAERRVAVQAFFDHVSRDQALLPQLTPEVRASLPVDATGITQAIDHLGEAAGLDLHDEQVQAAKTNAAVLHGRVFGREQLSMETINAAFADGARARAQTLAHLADAVGADVAALLSAEGSLETVYAAQERAALEIATHLDESAR